MVATLRAVTFANGLGSVTPAMPTGATDGDLLILVIEGEGEDVNADNPPTGGAWTAIGPGSVASATDGAVDRTRCSVYWAPYSAGINRVVPDAGDHTNAALYAWAGADTSSPFDGTGSGSNSTNGTAHSAATGITTTGADRVVCLAYTHGDDALGAPSPANTSLTGVTDGGGGASASGSDGTVGLLYGTRAAAGTGGTFTWSTSATEENAWIAFAIKPAPPPPTIQEAYRFRDAANANVAINDTNWGVAQNTTMTVLPGRKYRLRTQIAATSSYAKAYKYQYQINAGAWTDLGVNNPGASDLRTAVAAVEVAANSGYTHAAATTDLLTGGTGSFVAGEGLDTGITTGTITLNNQHTEIEITFWFNLWNASHETAFFADGDTIQFRLVESTGTVITTYSVTPQVTVDIPVGYVGGQFVENPAGVGPFKASGGNLFFLSEPYEFNPVPVMWRSSTGGDTWFPQDQINNPATTDLEGIAIRQVSDILHVAHWGSLSGNDGVYYHRFNMAGPSWAEVDTVVDNNSGAGLARRDQAISMEVKSNGDIVLLYLYDVAPNCKIGMRRRIGGTWDTSTTIIWNSTDGNWTGVTSVLDPNTDIVYAFAHDDTAGDMFGKAILADGTRQNLFADTETGDGTLIDADADTNLDAEMNYVRPLYWNDGSPRVFIAWRDPTTTRIEGCQITVGSGGSVGSVVAVTPAGGGVPLNVGTSRQPGASLAHGSGTDDLICFYAFTDTLEWGNSELYYVASSDGGATWSASGTAASTRSWGSRTGYVSANKFTHSAGNGGATVAGFVFYDATEYEEDYTGTADGGGHHGGWIWYDEIALAAPPVTKTHTSDAIKRATATRTHTSDAVLRATVARTHTSDAIVRVTVTRTHSSDAVLRATTTQAHTTDASLKGTSIRTHSSDAALRATVTRTHSSDAVLLARPLRTQTTDATLLGTSIRTHTTDGLLVARLSLGQTSDATLRATTVRPHSADAALVLRSSPIHTSDAVLRVTTTRTHTTDARILFRVDADHVTDAVLRATTVRSQTTDAILQARITRTHSTDVVLRATTTRIHTTDAVLLATVANIQTTDAVLLGTGTASHTTDAVVKATFSRTHSSDAVLRATATRTHSSDAVLASPGVETKTHTTDASLRATLARTHSSDAVLRATATQAHTSDAVLLATVLRTHTSDASLLGTTTVTHQTDASLKGIGVRAYTTDAVTSGALIGSHTTDAVLRGTVVSGHTTDALLVARIAVSAAADALLVARIGIAHTTDALLRATVARTHTTDAVLRVTVSLVQTTDAILRGTAQAGHTTDALLRGSVIQAHSTDALLLGAGQVVHTTDGILLTRIELTHTTDAALAGLVAHTVDAILLGPGTLLHSVDARLYVPPTHVIPVTSTPRLRAVSSTHARVVSSTGYPRQTSSVREGRNIG